MKDLNKNTLMIAAGTLCFGLLLGWLVFGRADGHPMDEHNHSTPTASETTWTCSMHPQIRQSEPGDCPICGMDLIPLESEGDEMDPMAVRMSPTAMQLAQVQTMKVNYGNAQKAIRLNGKVQADERLLFTQSSHIPGRVEKLAVNFTGEFIKEGQVIAHIYSPQLVTAQEELFEAQKIKETQPSLFHAAKEKLKNWKLTEGQIEQLLASNKIVEQVPILANVSGYVTQKKVNLGDYIQQGDALFEIADLTNVWVLFDVYESDMSWVSKGDPVSFTIPSFPGKTFEGKISYVDPVIDPKTRVAKARVEAANQGLMLKPEMFVSGKLVSKTHADNASLTVPKTAVMWTGKRSVVYVMKTSVQGVSFRMREVMLGTELGERFVIESGLQPGDEIAVNGTFSIDAAAQLAGKPSMMNREGGVAMAGHDHGGSRSGQTKITAEESTTSTLSNEAKKALQPIFDDYFKMKTALVNNDFEQAREAGKQINRGVSEVDMKLFQGDFHAAWMKHSSTLERNTQHVEHLSDIQAVRSNFIQISKTMAAIAEAFNPLFSPIYVQHCPMADSNNGGDWLSKEADIQNPYFGASMLTCGEVRKTIQ